MYHIYGDQFSQLHLKCRDKQKSFDCDSAQSFSETFSQEETHQYAEQKVPCLSAGFHHFLQIIV